MRFCVVYGIIDLRRILVVIFKTSLDRSSKSSGMSGEQVQAMMMMMMINHVRAYRNTTEEQVQATETGSRPVIQGLYRQTKR